MNSEFNDDYLYFYKEPLELMAEIEFEALTGLIQLSQGMRILDLPCGHGRISRRLAHWGAQVTGLDISRPSIEVAQVEAAAAAHDIEYVLGDMREIPKKWAGQFDAVVMCYNSFGYFDDDDNQDVINGVYRSLKPGGVFVFDQVSRYYMLKLGVPGTQVMRRGDDVLINEFDYNIIDDRFTIEGTVLRDGKTSNRSLTMILYSIKELTVMLKRSGFAEVNVTDRDGNPPDASTYQTYFVCQK